jgi:hypothetical protein
VLPNAEKMRKEAPVFWLGPEEKVWSRREVKEKNKGTSHVRSVVNKGKC